MTSLYIYTLYVSSFTR